MQNEILTRKEVAALLRCSLVTLDRLSNSGKLTKIRLTFKRVGFLKSDLDLYLKDQRMEVAV
jgi:predicted DNA-binding transcriptional regulator AlpA